MSPSVTDVLGAPPEYWIGREICDIIPPEDRAGFSQRLATLEAGGTIQRRSRLITRDGDTHWVHLHSKPFYDAAGRQDGYTSALRVIDDEVAAQHEAEKARRRQSRADALYRRSMDSAAVGMALTDPKGRFLEVNESLCRFFGLDAQALSTKTWQELTVAEYLQADLEKRAQVLAGEIESYRLVKKFHHAGGHEVWGDLSVGCIRDGDGRVETFIKQIIDITSEMESREQLEESRRLQAAADELYRRSVDSAAVGMSVVSTTGRFVEVNNALCEFFGYEAETLKQKTWQELTAPPFLQADLSNAADLLAGRIDAYRMLKQYVHADGRHIWGELSVGCLRRPDGTVEHFISQITDVTAEVEAREQLAKRDQKARALTERLTSEIRSAAKYVISTLPEDLHGPVEVSSRYLPSEELGGDSFHFRWIDDDLLKFYLVDVSGHGIRPALQSMSVHNLVRLGSLPLETLLQPDRVLTELNRLFRMEQQGGNYFTIWYGIYQASTRTLRYASAGHPPVLAFSSCGDNGLLSTRLTTTSLPIGLFDDSEFETATYTVPPGCRMVLFSDGAFELSTADGGHWSFDDFTELASQVAASEDFSADALVEQLRARTVNGEFEDDCSIITVAFNEG